MGNRAGPGDQRSLTKVTKRELAARVAERTELSASLIAEVVQACMEEMVDELIKAGRLEWRELGTFTVKQHAARKIHVPATGQIMKLKPRKSVRFKPSKKIRTRLKKKTA